jgi:hypothetical protein
MEENERLLKESQMTWEEKLKETQAASEARDEELTKMGVASGVDKAALQEKQGRVPHLSNLNEDMSLSSSVVYFLEEGSTRFGSSDDDVDVKLVGLSIKAVHCVITNTDNRIVVSAADGKVCVNGVQVSVGTELHNDDRVIVGNNYVFKMTNNAEAATGSVAVLCDEQGEPVVVDWGFAMKEANAVQMVAQSTTHPTLLYLNSTLAGSHHCRGEACARGS